MNNVTFPLAAGGAGVIILFPGGSENATADGVWVASGCISSIAVEGATTPELLIQVFDARDATGAAFQSANKQRYEVELTGLAGVRGTTPNRFEVYATALVGGPALSTHNDIYRIQVPAATSLAVTSLNLDCETGMVIQVTTGAAITGTASLSVSYESKDLGAFRKRRAADKIHLYTS